MSLVVDLETMNAARIDIERIHREFTEAGHRSETLAGAVGHAGLSDRVREFAGNWDLRRKELADQLAVVRDGLETIVTGFTETDNDLARAVAVQEKGYAPRAAAAK
jgi:hypothetical protein